MKNLRTLEIGKKYTLVKSNDFGFVNSYKFELIRIEVKPYAQYQESILLVIKLKGKRKLTGLRFNEDQDLIVWEGFCEPKTDMFVSSENMGVFQVQKSLCQFDPEYFAIALKSVEQTPLLCNVKGVK